MLQARIVVELLRQDVSGRKLLESLCRSLDVGCADVQCIVEPRHEFPIAPTFEEGADAAVRAALTYADAWCIYLAPRRLFLTINGTERRILSGVIIAMTRYAKPAALFLHTIASDELPEHIWAALSHKVNDMRERLVSEMLSDVDEEQAECFRRAIENAYAGAFVKSSMN